MLENSDAEIAQRLDVLFRAGAESDGRSGGTAAPPQPQQVTTPTLGDASSRSAEAASEGNLELPVADQLARARPWEPSPSAVLDDLSDEEEAAFLVAVRH